MQYDEEVQELLKHLKKKKFQEKLQNEKNCFYLYSPIHPARFAEYIETQVQNLGDGPEDFKAQRLDHL